MEKKTSKRRKKVLYSSKNKPPEELSIRKELYLRLLYIVIGIIMIALVWERNGIERFIGLAGLLFSMYHLLILIALSVQIIDDFFPPKTYNTEKATKIDKMIYYLAMGIFFLGLISVFFGMIILDNTIEPGAFFLKFAFFGLLIAAILTLFLNWKIPSVYEESERRFSVFFGIFIGFFLFIPSLASFINYVYTDEREICQIYTIVKKQISTRGGRSIFLIIKDNTENISISRDLYNSLTEGGQVQLCTQRGKLGYEVITKVRL